MTVACIREMRRSQTDATTKPHSSGSPRDTTRRNPSACVSASRNRHRRGRSGACSPRPLEVVEQRPCEIAARIHAGVDGAAERLQIPAQEVDALRIMHLAVRHHPIDVRHAIFRDDDRHFVSVVKKTRPHSSASGVTGQAKSVRGNPGGNGRCSGAPSLPSRTLSPW